MMFLRGSLLELLYFVSVVFVLYCAAYVEIIPLYDMLCVLLPT